MILLIEELLPDPVAPITAMYTLLAEGNARGKLAEGNARVKLAPSANAEADAISSY